MPSLVFGGEEGEWRSEVCLAACLASLFLWQALQGIPQAMPAGGGYWEKGMSGEGAEELCNLLESGPEREREEGCHRYNYRAGLRLGGRIWGKGRWGQDLQLVCLELQFAYLHPCYFFHFWANGRQDFKMLRVTCAKLMEKFPLDLFSSVLYKRC